MTVLTLTGLGSQLAGFFYRVLLTRMAGAEVLGLYQLILPVYGVLTALTAGGLTTAVSNLTAASHALGDRRAMGQLRDQAVGLFLLLCLLPCLALTLFSGPISVHLLGEPRTAPGLRLLAPCLVLTGVENLHKHHFYGVGRVVPPAVTELLEQLLRAGLCLGCLAVLRPAGAAGALRAVVLGMALCEAAAAITQGLLFRLDMGPAAARTGPGQPPRRLRRKLRQIAAPLGLAAVLGSLLSSANALLIPRLLVRSGMDQGSAVEIYGVVFGMALPMLLVPTAFLSALSLVLTPALARHAALGDREAIRDCVARGAEGLGLALLPALALLTALGPGLGQALCGTWRIGSHLPLLALGVLLSCWHGFWSAVLSGLGRQKTAAVIVLSCDGVQLLLTAAAVCRWGIGGYAAAFALSGLLGAVWARRAADRELVGAAVAPRLLAPALTAALAAACGSLMETALLRRGLDLLPAAGGGLLFGGLLVPVALGAMGVRFPSLDMGRAGECDCSSV